MAVKLFNRVRVFTATVGTGTITLGAAVPGYQSFADGGVNDGDEVRYTLTDGNDWEIGLGVYTASGTTMSRTPSESSNSGAAINLGGTQGIVFLTAAAVDIDNSIGGEDPPVIPTTLADFKDSCLVASTANVTRSGEQTIDGVLTSTSRVLLKDQTNGAENGIYVTAAGAWSRGTDADHDDEVTSGLLVAVEEGTISGAKQFMLITPDPIVVGTTPLTFDTVILPSGATVNKEVTATSYTFIVTDNGKTIRGNNGSAQTFTVPGSSVKLPNGAEIYVLNWGAGLITFAAGGGVTINSEFGLTMPRQYSMALLKKIVANTWSLSLVTPTTASQAEMEAGSETALRLMSPLRVAQAIAALAGSAVTAASQAEMEAGTEAALRSMSPLRVAQAIAALATGKQTIWIPASAMLAATTSGPASAQVETATNKVNVSVLDFDATADEYAHFNIAFPKSWNLGTVSFRVWWTTSATDTDGVAWGLEAIALSDNEAADTAWGTAVVVTDDAQGATTEILVTAESSALTIGGTPAAADLVFFRLFRDVSDANDDMTEDARLLGVQVFYTTNAKNDA